MNFWFIPHCGKLWEIIDSSRNCACLYKILLPISIILDSLKCLIGFYQSFMSRDSINDNNEDLYQSFMISNQINIYTDLQFRYGFTFSLCFYILFMGLQFRYGFTVSLWVYSFVMILHSLYGFTVLLWVYSFVMILQSPYGFTVLWWVYSFVMILDSLYDFTVS